MHLLCNNNSEASDEKSEVQGSHALPAPCKEAHVKADGTVCTSQSTKGKSTIAFSDTKQENGLPVPLYSSSSDSKLKSNTEQQDPSPIC